ncbi:hypothetical protein MIZ03_1709 [Rhodoferax lithotrophicus]|uniref:Uncharacterized protein n=1 Tax=Rhodoferax lithotrophicus TaxID=2798804 RepID=A0ABM7MKP1_9BURK|nr:hypothetical protein MIZ03_1709 [Rhodoferax sp. MIZ03]
MQATYQQKRGAGLLETHHRASGLVQRNVHGKTCKLFWPLRMNLVTKFS